MKHLKRFNESNIEKYILISYNPEKTAIIIDSNNQIVDSIDFLFEMGEYSEEAKEKFKKYNISGRTIGSNKDHYMVGNEEDITEEDALQDYLDKKKIRKDVDDFLTPEKEEELINLFRKRNKK